MTNIFKKSLVAIALASVSTGAMAATMTTTMVDVDSAWAAAVPAQTTGATPTAANRIALSDIVLNLGAEYANNDLITLTFSGAVDVSSLPTTVAVAAGAGTATLTLGLISTEATTAGGVKALYRVTNLSASGSTVGNIATFSGVTIGPDKIGSGLTVSFAAQTNNGLPLDTTGTTAQRNVTAVRVGTALNAVALTSGVGTSLDATIDVAKSRYQFAAGKLPGAAVFGISPVTYAAPAPAFAPAAAYSVTTTKVEYTMTGDFSWLLKADGTANAAAGSFAAAGCTNTVKATTISSVCSAGPFTFNPVFTVAAANKVAIPVQNYSLTAKVSYTATPITAPVTPLVGTVEKTLSNAGKWVLNGSNVTVAYMPYNPSISQIINVTNRSSQQGDITVTAIDEAGVKTELGVVGVSKPNSIQQIAGAVKTALEAKLGVASSTKRYAFEIVTNAPDGQVEVYSAYNVSGTGARLVVNSSNGK